MILDCLLKAVAAKVRDHDFAVESLVTIVTFFGQLLSSLLTILAHTPLEVREVFRRFVTHALLGSVVLKFFGIELIIRIEIVFLFPFLIQDIVERPTKAPEIEPGACRC